MCGERGADSCCGDVCAKLKQEQSYREKVTTSLAVYGIFAVIGGIKGQIGPAFLDLQSICDVGLEEGSWIVTSLYIGYTLGALANGFLYQRCNGNLLFAVSTMCLAVIVVVTPRCTIYSLMVACHTGMGLVVGLIDAAGNAEIIRLWKTKSKTILVGLHVIFNLGGVISPLIIAPFLKGHAEIPEDLTTASPDLIAVSTTDTRNISLQHTTKLLQQTSTGNTSQIDVHDLRHPIHVFHQNSTYNTTQIYVPEEASRIYIAYMISSVFCVLHTLWFVLLYFVEKGNKNRGNDSHVNKEHSNESKHSNEQEYLNKQRIVNGRGYLNEQEHSNKQVHFNEQEHSNEQGHLTEQELLNEQGNLKIAEAETDVIPSQEVKDKCDIHIPRHLQILGLVVMVTISSMSNAIDFSFSTYLSSFCVEFLHWSNTSGSMITSLLFILVVLGGTLSMFLTKCINSVVYIGIQMSLIIVSMFLLLLSITLDFTTGVWLSAPLFGFAKSAIFPLVIAWTNNIFIRVSGQISSVFFVGAMGGCSINLFMLASVMESIGKIWFCYVLIIESISLIIFFITAVLLSQYVKRWKRKQIAKLNDQES